MTLPETPEWIGTAMNASVSPIFCPTSTVSRGFTRGVQGAPICMLMGIRTSFGSGSGTEALFSVFLWCARCTPCSFFIEYSSFHFFGLLYIYISTETEWFLR